MTNVTDPSLEISVVIPVYNAGPYVRKAVESALEQPETAEVLLIEDGSPDNSLEVCRELDAEYEKVRLFTHANNANRGAGPSRNVGIENARFEFIAFLDADDFYLPKRFSAEVKIFKDFPDTDGVYGAAGYHFYSDEGRERYSENGFSGTLTICEQISPERFFDAIIGIEKFVGFTSIITLTVKTRAIIESGLFSSQRLHQDVEFIYKLSYKHRLRPGQLDKPVSMIGVHDSNRMVRVSKRSKDKAIMFANLYTWSRQNELPKRYSRYFKNFKRLEQIRSSNNFFGLFYLLKASFSWESLLLDRGVAIAALDHVTCGFIVPPLVKLKQKLFNRSDQTV